MRSLARLGTVWRVKVTTKLPQASENSPQAPEARRLGLNESGWTYGFKKEGRIYTLTKRNQSRDGVWWLECVIHGRRIRESLGTNGAAAAAERAWRQFIEPGRAGRWTMADARAEQRAEKRVEQVVASVGEVLAMYETLCVGKVSPLTVRNNLNAMRLIVRRGLGNENMMVEDIDRQSSAVLTGKLVAEFEDYMARAAVKLGRDLESNKRSVAGYLRQARSVFKATALPRYAEKGLNLADVSDFMNRDVESAIVAERQPPSDELLAKTLAGSRDLREVDRPAYIAWLLGFSTLRRAEIGRMQWSWLVQIDGASRIRVPSQSKGKREALVPVDELVARELAEYQAMRVKGVNPEEEAYVLPSPRCGQGGPAARMRAQNVFKRVNAWMRLMGWETNHTLHEMRSLMLSLVRDEHGLDTAQAFGRHKDQRTTQQSYVGMKSLKGVVVKLPLPALPVAAS